MEIKLPFGNEESVLRLPPGITTDYPAPRIRTPISDPMAALREALASPVGGDPLDAIVGGASSVVILLSDLTRGRGTLELLPHLIASVREAGVETSAITILVARGMHRGMTKEERELFRDLTAQVIEHDADEPDNLSALLLTRHGTPVRTAAILKDADAVILLSPISYHYFAGYGGGRKLVLPGCADRAAITANHKLSLVPGKPVALHPACLPGNLEGNPVHEDMIETLDALRGRGLLGVNFIADTSGQLVFINAGDPVKAHVAACETYDADHRLPVRTPFDVMVVSAGGLPYDIDLVQAHKTLRHVAGGVSEGGTILYFAQCAEGVGSDTFASALRMNHKDFLKNAYDNYELNYQTAVSLLNLTERFEIGMVSSMNVDTLLAGGIKPCVNAEAFLADALDRHSASRIAVVTHGSRVLITGDES